MKYRAVRRCKAMLGMSYVLLHPYTARVRIPVIMQDKIRSDLMQIFNSGLNRVKGRRAVIADLEAHRPSSEALHLVAIGKAASDMTLGALDVLGNRIKDGLLITKHLHTAPELHDHNSIEVIESDHPVPSDKSLEAGRRLLAYLESRTVRKAHFLFLLSGGASSLVEVLPAGMRLENLKNITEVLLAKGLDIGQMNAVRQSLSCIKGGRLAMRLEGCAVLNLMISDVPGDDPSVIGSGLLNPPHTKPNFDDYPTEIKDCLTGITLVPPPDAEVFRLIDTRIVARLDNAKKACVNKAIALGYDARLMPDFVAGDVVAVAERLCDTLFTDKHQLLVWGGEPSMQLPQSPGRGGRNQHLALLIAERLSNEEGVYFVIAGTDGSDGPTTDAGALVDGTTVRRASALGLDIKHSLANADSGSFLEQTGDLINTGPTGTNVMDLMIGLRI